METKKSRGKRPIEIPCSNTSIITGDDLYFENLIQFSDHLLAYSSKYKKSDICLIYLLDLSVLVVKNPSKGRILGLEQCNSRTFIFWDDLRNVYTFDLTGKIKNKNKFFIEDDSNNLGRKVTIDSALQLDDGNFVIGDSSGIVYLFTSYGSTIQKRKKHTGSVYKIKKTVDGRFITFSEDNCVYLWNKDFDVEAQLLGVTERIIHIENISDEEFVTRSFTNNFHIWKLPSTRLVNRAEKEELVFADKIYNSFNSIVMSNSQRIKNMYWSYLDSIKNRSCYDPTIMLNQKIKYQLSSGNFISHDGKGSIRFRIQDTTGYTLSKFFIDCSKKRSYRFYLTYDEKILCMSENDGIQIYDLEGNTLKTVKGIIRDKYMVGPDRYFHIFDKSRYKILDSTGNVLYEYTGHSIEVQKLVRLYDGRLFGVTGVYEQKHLFLWDDYATI